MFATLWGVPDQTLDNRARMNPDEVPDYSEALVGWRAWHLYGKNGRMFGANPFLGIAPPRRPHLRSMVMVAQWPQKQPFRATCHMNVDPFRRYLIGRAESGLFDRNGRCVHESPDPRCFCGIYATRTLNHLWLQFALDHYGSAAIGEVWLWGNVIEATDGFRAQYAYPKQLFIAARAKRSAKWLRKTYGVPVTVVQPFMSSVELALEEQNGGR